MSDVSGDADEGACRPIAVCVGMSFWKRRRIAQFLDPESGTLRFARTAAGAVTIARSRGGSIAVWGPREPRDLAARAAAAGVPVIQVEDGFLRSVGLGSDFTPGASIVVDRRGIYYDPSRPSDLERILSNTRFDEAILGRARRLIDRIVASGITKYNTGVARPVFDGAGSRRRIFVPGQVEDDRSVVLGGAGITSNLELLRRVRAANPDAFILYKPHPDVDAGHRNGALSDDEAGRFADQVVRGVSSAAILDACDEVQTLTSLAGFEALLRGRRVVVHGQPFYAGWGLTVDLAAPPRRGRGLRLEELVAGALILYPRYLDPVSQQPCTPEALIDRLADRAAWPVSPLIRLRRLQGRLMRGLREGSVRWRLRPS